MAAVAVCLLFLLGMIGHSNAAYCICNAGINSSALQKDIDYACGNGADCTAILQNGACYNPSTVQDHCNYAVNSYYQRKGQVPGSCDFSGTATISQTIPNQASGCVYPSSSSTAGTATTPSSSTTPSTTTPSTTTPSSSTTPSTTTPSSSTTPSTTTPSTTTPSSSITPSTPTTGTTGTPPSIFGLGPTGSGGITNTDKASLPLHQCTKQHLFWSFTLTLFLSGPMFF